VGNDNYYAEEEVTLTVRVRVSWRAAHGEPARQLALASLLDRANERLINLSGANDYGCYGVRTIAGTATVDAPRLAPARRPEESR
jgi:hypothetical protein